MISEFDFLELRKKILASDQSLKEKAFTQKIPNLLEVLGEPSSQLRDDLGWSTLSVYFRSDLCPNEIRAQLIELLISDKFLFFNIETGESDFTLKRSFSALTIADLLIGDVQNGLMITPNELSNIAFNLRDYFLKENDWRGFGEKLGWVHSLAHLGDAFYYLSEHPLFPNSEALASLNSILIHLDKRGRNPFLWQEDFRLGRAISSLLMNLPENEVCTLLENKFSRSDLSANPALQNILTTFRCAYLNLIWKKSNKIKIIKQIEKIIS
jgi:hypothetical protein